jgi:hypothetical protein
LFERISARFAFDYVLIAACVIVAMAAIVHGLAVQH